MVIRGTQVVGKVKMSIDKWTKSEALGLSGTGNYI
jgi:hypothetical protein